MALFVEENAQNLTSASVNLSLIPDQKQPVHLFLYILSTQIHNKYCYQVQGENITCDQIRTKWQI